MGINKKEGQGDRRGYWITLIKVCYIWAQHTTKAIILYDWYLLTKVSVH